MKTFYQVGKWVYPSTHNAVAILQRHCQVHKVVVPDSTPDKEMLISEVPKEKVLYKCLVNHFAGLAKGGIYTPDFKQKTLYSEGTAWTVGKLVGAYPEDFERIITTEVPLYISVTTPQGMTAYATGVCEKADAVSIGCERAKILYKKADLGPGGGMAIVIIKAGGEEVYNMYVKMNY